MMIRPASPAIPGWRAVRIRDLLDHVVQLPCAALYQCLKEEAAADQSVRRAEEDRPTGGLARKVGSAADRLRQTMTIAARRGRVGPNYLEASYPTRSHAVERRKGLHARALPITMRARFGGGWSTWGSRSSSKAIISSSPNA